MVGEAEGVFANGVSSEDVVALTLALAVDNHVQIRICDNKVNVEGAASLDLQKHISQDQHRVEPGVFGNSSLTAK